VASSSIGVGIARWSGITSTVLGEGGVVQDLGKESWNCEWTRTEGPLSLAEEISTRSPGRVDADFEVFGPSEVVTELKELSGTAAVTLAVSKPDTGADPLPASGSGFGSSLDCDLGRMSTSPVAVLRATPDSSIECKKRKTSLQSFSSTIDRITTGSDLRDTL